VRASGSLRVTLSGHLDELEQLILKVGVADLPPAGQKTLFFIVLGEGLADSTIGD
jgi:hypothetical protein